MIDPFNREIRVAEQELNVRLYPELSTCQMIDEVDDTIIEEEYLESLKSTNKELPSVRLE